MNTSPQRGSQPSSNGLPEPFRCEVTRDADLARLQVLGELDLQTVPRLEAEIAAVRAGGVKRVIIDLRGLEFMDSTGLRCLLECDAEARQDGFSLALVPGPPAVQRVFEVTQSHLQLPFIAS